MSVFDCRELKWDILNSWSKDLPVLELYLEKDSTIGDLLIRYDLVDDLMDFFRRRDEKRILIANPEKKGLKKLDYIDDAPYIRKHVYYKPNCTTEGIVLIQLIGESKKTYLVRVHIPYRF